MCGRYNLYHPVNEAAAAFHAEMLFEGMDARYNIAPTQMAPVIMPRDGTNVMKLLRWGLVPAWAPDLSVGGKMINARAETVGDKPAYRNCLRTRRCAVPANGYYEWQREAHQSKNKMPPQPVYVHHQSDAVLAFAGIWDSWRGPAGDRVESYSIITVPAPHAMSHIHDRMPAILDNETLNIWLDADVQDKSVLTSVLRGTSDGLVIYPVSKIVNSPANDVPACILPVTVVEQTSMIM